MSGTCQLKAPQGRLMGEDLVVSLGEGSSFTAEFGGLSSGTIKLLGEETFSVLGQRFGLLLQQGRRVTFLHL